MHTNAMIFATAHRGMAGIVIGGQFDASYSILLQDLRPELDAKRADGDGLSSQWKHLRMRTCDANQCLVAVGSM